MISYLPLIIKIGSVWPGIMIFRAVESLIKDKKEGPEGPFSVFCKVCLLNMFVKSAHNLRP